MTGRILGVHGIGNHRAGRDGAAVAALGATWSAALARGLGVDAATVDVEVCYYAPRLHRDHAQAGDPLAALDPAAEALVLAWVASLGAPDDVAQGRLTQPVRRAVEWAADRLGRPYEWLATAFVGVFFGEVSRYLGDPVARRAARDDVAAALAACRPDVVIAHSLGSVVAWEALCVRPDVPVPLLVTVGSPLGLPGVVYERLDPGPAAVPGRRPPGVARWVNVADVGDFIAVPERLGSLFGVDEEHRVSIHPVDFHRVVTYLGCPEVAAAVRAG